MVYFCRCYGAVSFIFVWYMSAVGFVPGIIIMATGPSYWSLYRRSRKQTSNDLDALFLSNITLDLQKDDVDTFSDDLDVMSQCDTVDFGSFDDNNCCYMELTLSENDLATPELASSDYSDVDFYSDDERDSHDEEENDVVQSIPDKLAQWSAETGIGRVQINKLLMILRPVCPNLPRDARTLLQTPRHIETKSSGSGDYVHFGLEAGIVNKLNRSDINIDELQLQFNIDGLPLFKSSNTQIWPILCLIKNSVMKIDPFVVGLFGGPTKPPVVWLGSTSVSAVRQCS